MRLKPVREKSKIELKNFSSWKLSKIIRLLQQAIKRRKDLLKLKQWQLSKMRNLRYSRCSRSNHHKILFKKSKQFKLTQPEKNKSEKKMKRSGN